MNAPHSTRPTAAASVLATYDAMVTTSTSAARTIATASGTHAVDLAAAAKGMRARFEERTGCFGPDDPWFEGRSRAFWDDALTTQHFAVLSLPMLADEEARILATRFDRAHRGLFRVSSVDDGGVHLVDVWGGAELLVHVLDEAQATTFTYGEGLIDGRAIAGPAEGGGVPPLFLLPGALHHGPEATAPIRTVLHAARARAMTTGDTLDALLRMEHVLRKSSRVKTAFAYRAESLPPSRHPVV